MSNPSRPITPENMADYFTAQDAKTRTAIFQSEAIAHIILSDAGEKLLDDEKQQQIFRTLWEALPENCRESICNKFNQAGNPTSGNME